jgi:hypothetical protein
MATRDEMRPPSARELQSANLFLLQDVDNATRTKEFTESDRDALRAVADWIKAFVAKPHNELGRAGPVCPFVPGAWKHKTLWLSVERSAARSTQEIIQLIEGYKRLLLAAQPVDGDEANYKSIVVVFADLPASQAKDFFNGVLQQIGATSYVDDGLVIGPFYEGSDATSTCNPKFRPFTSPMPFLAIRGATAHEIQKFPIDHS